jgi:hypothetical protein
MSVVQFLVPPREWMGVLIDGGKNHLIQYLGFHVCFLT